MNAKIIGSTEGVRKNKYYNSSVIRRAVGKHQQGSKCKGNFSFFTCFLGLFFYYFFFANILIFFNYITLGTILLFQCLFTISPFFSQQNNTINICNTYINSEILLPDT